MRFGRAPGAWPFLGHAVALQRRPLALLDSLPAHGDLVEIRLGPRPAFVLCHPDLARRVLTDFRGFDRAGLGYERVRTAMGNGLATAAQQDHRRQRLVMQPAFRREHLRGYVAVMRREITAAMANWPDGEVIDLVEEMFTLTTTIALRALVSSQLGSEHADRLRRAFDVFLWGIYARAVAYWRGQVSELIDGYRQAGAGPEDRDDLMSRLLAARDEQGQALSATELADQVAVLMLAGGETTSAAVAWSWHLLCGHPDPGRGTRRDRRGPGPGRRGLGAPAPAGPDRPGGARSAAPVPARLGHPADVHPPGQPGAGTSRPVPSWSSAPTSCTAAPTCTPSRTASTPPAGSPRRRNCGRPTSRSARAPRYPRPPAPSWCPAPSRSA